MSETATIYLPSCEPTHTKSVEELVAENTDLKRQIDILTYSPGRMAFAHRHFSLCYVRKHAHGLYNDACNYGYQKVTKDGVPYDDYVATLEARIRELEGEE